MGICATRSLSRDCHAEEEEESNITSSSPFAKEPLRPAQPHIQSSHSYGSMPRNLSPLLANIDLMEQSFSKPTNSPPEEAQATISARSPTIQSPSKPKMAKKVTFADDLVQTPNSNQPLSQQEAATPKRSSTVCEQEAHQSCPSGDDSSPQSEGQMEDISASHVKEGAGPNTNTVKKEVDGVVRLKVVLSKKQLSELMSSRSILGKQAGDALMQKMLAQVKPTKNAQSWGPSLDLVPESYSAQRLVI